jgi:subtilisin family serine protease
MKTIQISVLMFFVIFTVPLAAAENTLKKENIPKMVKADHVPGELLVKYKPSTSSESTRRYRNTYGITRLKTFRLIGVQHVNLPRSMNVEEALTVYAEDPSVEYAEPNYIYHDLSTFPDDLITSLWGLRNTGQSINGTVGTNDCDIDAPEAWDFCTGSDQVIVAVIDGGVDYNHPDLEGNIWINPNETMNGVDDDNNGYIDDIRGWDWVDDDNDPMDFKGHGTHCAGTIAAAGNNSLGITGVCWSAKIMPLRHSNTLGVINIADSISAIQYATQVGAHVISNSWGGYGYSSALRDAIAASSAVVVCAAGNDGIDNDGEGEYPASYDCSNIIAVAATDQDDNLAAFSNYGGVSVDVGAPGVNIFSAEPARRTIWYDGFDDGTLSPWFTGGISGGPFGLTDLTSLSPLYCLSDSPYSYYPNYADHYAQVSLSGFLGFVGTKLTYYLCGQSEIDYDYLHVQTSSDGLNWNTHDSWHGSGNWSGPFPADIKAHEGGNDIHIRFRFTSDFSITYDGWYIDDVQITAWSPDPADSGYQFKNGTSMATPHVSGLAALIKAYDMNLNNLQIKAVIENNVDSIGSLSGMVSTGGRINAYKCLHSLSSQGEEPNGIPPAIHLLLLDD